MGEGGREEERERVTHHCPNCLKWSSWGSCVSQCCPEVSSWCPDASLAVLMPTLALTADCLPLHWTHTTSLSLLFHLISTFPSGWWPWSPLGNLNTGSHGYRWLPDRRLLWADGCLHWVRNRLRGYLSYPASCILLFTLSPRYYVCVCWHTRLSLDPAWSGLDRELMMFQISQVLQQPLTLIEQPAIFQTMTYEMVCILTERNNLPGQFKVFSFSDRIQIWLLWPSLLGISVDCWCE